MTFSIRSCHFGAAILVAVLTAALPIAHTAQAQECTRVTDRGIQVRLPQTAGAETLHVQYRSESGTWRNLRDLPPSEEQYIGDVTAKQAVTVRVRARTTDGYGEWSSDIGCAAEPVRAHGETWEAYLAAVDAQPFEVFGWPGTEAQLASALGRGAEVSVRDRHLVVSRHAGALTVLPRIAFAGARLGAVPRFGVDGHGDPGPLTTDEQNLHRALFDAIASWERIRPVPGGAPAPGKPGAIPDWAMPGLVIGSLNPAPDGGGYPEDGTGLGPDAKMCKALVCEPFSCGTPPLPPGGEFTDCSGLAEELDALADLIDYWESQAQFWFDTVNYLDLAIKGKATAESGVAVAKMASALGLILAPEPISTVTGIVIAAQTFGSFAWGQFLDAIGVCPSAADCSMSASLQAAREKLGEALSTVAALRAEALELQAALQACLQAAAVNNAELQAAMDAYLTARAEYEACVASQVCQWVSRPCGT